MNKLSKPIFHFFLRLKKFSTGSLVPNTTQESAQNPSILTSNIPLILVSINPLVHNTIKESTYCLSTSTSTESLIPTPP